VHIRLSESRCLSGQTRVRLNRGENLVSCFCEWSVRTSMANKYGLFGETAFLAVGDPYIDKDPLNQRTQGLNFKVLINVPSQLLFCRYLWACMSFYAPGFDELRWACMGLYIWTCIYEPVNMSLYIRSRRAEAKQSVTIWLVWLNSIDCYGFRR
jgi:hypothetical protein